MEYWKSKAAEHTERCDFAGLPKSNSNSKEMVNDNGICNGYQDHPNLKEKVVPYGYRNTVLNGLTFKYLSSVSSPSKSSSISSMRLPAIINLAWHKALSVYGNGSHTITVTSLKFEDGDEYGSKVIPVIGDHTKYGGMKVSEILREIEMDMEQSLRDDLTVKLEEMTDDFCDSVIILGGGPSNDWIKSGAPLILNIGEKDGAFDIGVFYNSNLFHGGLIDGVMDYFKNAVEQLIDEGHQHSVMSAIEFLPPVQKRQIEKWNDLTTGAFPETKRLHHLVEEAATATPDKTAVICQDVQLTYQELNERANQVGHWLHSQLGIEPEQFIALFLDKTEVLLMTILGIWKSGAAHIPIDPNYPDERVKFILEDTGAKFIIANERHRERLEGIFSDPDLKIITVEGLLEMAKLGPRYNLDLPLRSDQLAYVTYTSGTTGVPKGVYKEHKGVVNSITDLSIRYGMREGPDEVVALFSAYVWEPFIRQSMITLVNSQLLVIVDDNDKLDPIKFIEFMNKYGVTYLNGTGSVLQEYELEKCPTLRKLILVGEELTKTRYDHLRGKYQGRIICEYGFTESALVTCMNDFKLGDQRTDRSIGRPLRNVKAYILDGHLKRVPVGAIGELYIGGVGISRGYMNRESLTQERFLENPYQTQGERAKGINHLMYKTGDLARWMKTGQIEYIGRNDFQIKLRGNRVEPGEIEAVVLQYPQVKKCTVAVKDSRSPEESTASSRHLVGYFVADREIGEEEIIAYLEKQLPRWMIPVRMVQVEDIRTNINGKVDLKALPEVGFTRSMSHVGGAVQNPRNEVDSKLIKIWSGALGIPEDEIGIHHDFFRLGGHSITCIQLVARIRQQLNVEVSIDKIFTLRSIEKLSDFITSQIGSLQVLVTPNQSEISAGLELELENEEIRANSLQQGLVYHYLKQGEADDAYIMQTHYQYLEAVKVPLYKKAWKMAHAKYPSLRLNFKVRKEVYQIFRPVQSSHLDWTFVDNSEKSEGEQEADIDDLIRMDRETRYNLEEGPLFRIYLVKESDSRYGMVFSYHHIIIDGWSIPILFGFVHEAYQGLLKGLSSVPAIDTGYIHSQRYLEANRNDHLGYWTSEVEDVDQRVNLSGWLKHEMKFKVQLSTYDKIENQRQLTQVINPELLRQLYDFGATHGVTLHSILQFAWHKVLHTYGGGSHTIVGTTVSGRNIPVDGVESSVGLFINTLPLVVDHLTEEMSDLNLNMVQAIQEIQKKVNAMNSRSNVELGKLGGGGGSWELKHSLFDSLFVLEPDMDLGGFMGLQVVKDYEKLDYPLAVIAREEGGILKFCLYFAGELFQEEVIRDALELLEYFLSQVASHPDKPVKNMELVLPRQLHLMESWNQTRKPFPQDKTLHEIFEEAVVLSNPDKIALVYEDKKWTYRDLNGRANQLANYLGSLVALNPDDKVALILTKNDLLILSILGVWKAGAAFVPIDPGYPEERIRFMLEDTQAKVVILNGANEERLGPVIKLSNSSTKLVNIEKALENGLSDHDNTNLPKICSSTDLCYVIYTSGTTGQPKGVMTEHRGVVNLHDSLSTIFELKSTSKPKPEVLLSFSNFVFDHFVEQMTDALLSGQTLVILNDDMRTDKERLYNYIKDNLVTYLSGTPSVLSLYEYGGLRSITRIDAVGEDFTPAYFDKIRATFPSGIIINGYGPTETSITTHKRIYKQGEQRLDKSIGHQIYNSACYILNQNGQRVPIGAVGELHLGGVGVGRGYLNREDLTTKSFVGNPFATEQDRREGRNLRIYKTGDLARFLGNGEVECLGRNDFQVKVRGLRIELSEIEAAILSYPGISHCVVVAQNRNGGGGGSSSSFLVGYFISGSPQNEKDILAFLRRKLPSFMMPNRLVQVDAIPVTINGKCDTKRLPKVEFIKGHHNNLEGGTINLNEVETKLRFIWSELLGLPVEQIGLEDDFFSLGGDSLLVTSMTFMINKAFGRIVTVPQVFLNKSVKALGHLISQGGGGYQVEIPKADKTQFAPASLAQERLLFIDEMEGGTAALNVPFMFKLEDGADRELLVESLKLVVKRHQALRTLLVNLEDSYGQKVLSEDELEAVWPLAIQVKEVGITEEEEVAEAENYVFKLDKELPLRVTFARDPKKNESFISVVFHHSCFDGWSVPIFQRDWLSIYRYLQIGGDANRLGLPKLDYNYGDFSLFQRELLNGPNLNAVKSYWVRKLGNVEQLHLATDFERPSQFAYSGYEICQQLDSTMARALKDLAKEMKTSLYSILASAFALTMSIYSGQEDILIGVPISNRLRSEFQDVIGFFINILPLTFTVNQEWTVGDLIESVGDEVVTSHVNQDMPFDKLVKELKISKDLSRHPLVQVMLNFNPLAGPGPTKEKDDRDKDQVTPFHFVEDPLGNKDTTAKYDLSATITEEGGEGGLLINFTFAKSLFSASTVEGYLNSFVHLLTTFAQPGCLGRRIKELDLVGEDKPHKMNLRHLPLINDPYYDDVEGSTLPEIFDKIAAQCGPQTSLVYKDKHMSYDELNSRSNMVAGLLKKKLPIMTSPITGSPVIVALMMDKSDWLITAILGIWRSGAAYVPIDPSYPAERIRYILKDTGAKLIISNQVHEHRLTQFGDAKLETVIIDAPETLNEMEKVSSYSAESNLCGENDLAYVIYTSGSTGVPKGVTITHKNVLSFRDSLLLHHNKHERVLFLSNFVFDFSIEQLILSIFNWGRLIIPPERDLVMDDQFYAYLNQEKLTYLSGTPSVITAMDLAGLHHLGTVTVAGEMFKPGHFSKIRAEFGGRLINAYGVTETTVYNSISVFPPEDNIYRNSLGSFFPNSGYHLLDKHLRELPLGAVAELYLSGPCVSPGYLNLEGMNEKHFLSNPYSDKAGNDHLGLGPVLYRTGDMVRWNPASGELEYLHRNDHQVKIRGFRIELQEIEAVILKHGEISQCAVFCEEEDSLVGVFISKSKSQLAPEELRQFLEKSLPPHMIPSGLIEYDLGESLPVTMNGKQDMTSLRNFYRSKKNDLPQVGGRFTQPATKAEVELRKIFSSVLGIPEGEIGVGDDFFWLGGDSISSLLLAGKIRNRFGVKCNVKHVFDHRTIRKLCRDLGISDTKVITRNRDAESGQRPSGSVPLLPIQDWFFAKGLKAPGHYNQTFMMNVPQLDVQKLRESLLILVRHHDAFRLRFNKNGTGGYAQLYEDDVAEPEVNFHHLDLGVSGLDPVHLNQYLAELSSSLDIEGGPMYAVAYLEDKASNNFKIWWSIHHLIVDSVSWRIIKDDLEALYKGASLPGKGMSYQEFSRWLQQGHFLSERSYWDKIVEKVSSYNAKLTSAMTTEAGKPLNFQFNLSPTTTRRLFHQAKNSGSDASIQDYLLTAVSTSLTKLTGSSPTAYITLEGHGRHKSELSNTVGWFTSMYPVEIQVDLEGDILSNLKTVKRSLRSIPNKGIGYGTIYGYVDPPLPRVSFNFLGNFGSSSRSNKEWTLCDLSLGLTSSVSEEGTGCQDRSHNIVDITAACDNGSIKFSIDFLFQSEACQEFIDTVQNVLGQIAQNVEAIQKPLPFGDYEAYFEFPSDTNPGSPTLFILPPGEGGAESYFNNLVPSLKQFNLVVFNNYYLDSSIDTTFEELASAYLKYVKALQPRGPYNFLGWSFGGVMALEMSRQLASSGDDAHGQIQNLFLIDSYLNVGKAMKDLSLNIAEQSDEFIIDRINHRYTPTRADFEAMCSSPKTLRNKIILFKATLPNELSKTEKQHQFHEYFRHAPFNNVDTLIPPQLITVEEMEGHSHNSWAKDDNQVGRMSNIIKENMK